VNKFVGEFWRWEFGRWGDGGAEEAEGAGEDGRE